MKGRMEIRRWIRVGQPVYAVALSENGQFAAAGLENGIAIFNVDGERRFAYSIGALATAVHQLVTTGDLSQIYLLTRVGRLIRLDLDRDPDGFRAREHVLYQEASDLHTLALAEEGEVLAIGHLSSALSVLQTDGQLSWRFHAHDGTATEEQLWVTALHPSGDRLYIGSAGSETNILAVLDSRTGQQQAAHYTSARITAMTASAQHAAVIAVLADDFYTGRLAAFSDDLSTIVWEQEFDEPITALMADRQGELVAVGVGYEGQVMLLDTRNGDRMADPIVLKSGVSALAIANGRWLAVATQNDNLALIRFLP